MRFNFYCPVHFERWDFRNSIEKGIGGSETSTVEMSWRLAARGHEVTVYAPIPDDCPGEWRGVSWKPLDAVDYSLPGVWVFYRCPDLMDGFNPQPDQCAWMVLQDWDYPTWTPERAAKVDRIIPLCRTHEAWLLKRRPEFRGKTWVTRNGIKADLIAETEAAGIPERNPRRMMFASSPDRGLLNALLIFQRVKEFVPDAEFHVTYGFNNIDKLIEGGAKGFGRYKAQCMDLVEKTGAVFHGRLTQNELYREWFKTGILIYPTTFWETGWITGLEAQAMGAVPVYSPIWAQGENTRHGFPVIGNPDDPMTRARFMTVITGLMLRPELQENVRPTMMREVRAAWDWGQFVSEKPGENWEEAATQDLEKHRELCTA